MASLADLDQLRLPSSQRHDTDLSPAVTSHTGQGSAMSMRSAFFHNHHEYFAILDETGRFLDANVAFIKLLDRQMSEMIGYHFDTIMPEPDFSRWADIDAELKNSGYCQFKDWYQFAGSGKVKQIQFHLHTIPATAGRALNYALTGIDLSIQASYQDNLERLVSQDALTGLYNRRFIEEKSRELIARCTREDDSFAVFVLDLDGFKTVNDEMGHVVGDEVLRHVSDIMCDVVPLGETVGRIGGDEFVVIIEDFESRDDLFDLAEELRLAFARPIFLGSRAVRVSASIGISLFPQDGKDYAALVAQADRAMFKSKRTGKDAVTSPREDGAIFASESLESTLLRELATAINVDQFEPYFQNITDLETGEVIGAEALCRWLHPKRGILEPAAFIPIAEHNGMIADIDRLMLRKVCAVVQRLRGTVLEPVRIFSNVSAVTVGKLEFAQFVQDLLAETGVPASAIGLELTESMALMESENGRECLGLLHHHGIAIALDDFGTGFSSLSMLKDLPVSHLKLDRSFMRNIERNPRDLELLGAIITLGHALGTRVVVEGIETKRQREALGKIDRVYGQGYFIGRPLPQHEFVQSD